MSDPEVACKNTYQAVIDQPFTRICGKPKWEHKEMLLQEIRSIEEVALIGRWKSITSARTYLRAGEALLAAFLSSQSEETQERMVMLTNVAVSFFSSL